MSDDIKVLALRVIAKQREDELGKLFNDAADALEALVAERDRLKAALEVKEMNDHINRLIGRLRSYLMSNKYIIAEDIFAAADTIEALRAERDRLMREVDALQQWKDAAKAAEASWDLREVGKLISAPLGAPIRPAIQPAIERLAAENKQLRAERDRLKAALVRLRDCDWVIRLPDRMDGVRQIARKALGDKE
ncbi:MAG: hypothetical protein ACK6DM_12230 [Alphaproteobacteria bacterium]